MELSSNWMCPIYGEFTLYKLLTTLCVVSNCAPPQSNSLCLVLYCHFVRIALFIETTPPEAQLSTCSGIAYRDKMKTATAKVRWYNTKHREGMCACFQEKYYRVHVLLELL